MNRIPTKDASGNPNGWLLPLWHVDEGYRPDQVYLTTVAPGAMKGPHLHLRRCGRFRCIKGDVLIVTRECGVYTEYTSGERGGHFAVHVEPGVPAAIYNVGEGEAFVINMPSPPWRVDDQDDWPVTDWSYQR